LSFKASSKFILSPVIAKIGFINLGEYMQVMWLCLEGLVAGEVRVEVELHLSEVEMRSYWAVVKLIDGSVEDRAGWDGLGEDQVVLVQQTGVQVVEVAE
jgi:hypothetical protein